MKRERRAVVALARSGDPEIAGAIAEGMLTAAAHRGRGEPGRAEGLTVTVRARGSRAEDRAEIIEVVEAEIDRQHIMRALVRVAVGNDKSAEDYAAMVTRARGLYGTPARRGPVRRLLDGLVMGWALLWLGIRGAYDAQRHVLGGR